MPGVNKLTLIGNLGADPELRYTPDGKAVTNLRLAVNRSWKDKVSGDWQDETIWFQVDLWEQRAESAAEKFRKGDQLYVEGRLKPARQYTRSDGTVGVSLEVSAHTVLKLGKKEQGEDDEVSGPVYGRRESEARQQPEMDVDDIPF